MAGKISDLYVNIGAKTDDFKKGTQQVAKEGEKLGYSFKNVGSAIVGAFAASTVIAFGKECVQLANVAEGVEAAFKRIGNEQILDGLRKATKGTVSDLDLMKAAVQAKNFGIPLQQMGDLLAFAHQRAKDTGQSVDYLVQSIVMGIGRKSPLILDNLGISAVALKEKMKGIGTETATVGDVAKAVGEIAKDAMKGIGESASTAAEKSAQLTTQWTNMKTEIGKLINKGISPLKQALIDLFTYAKEMGQDKSVTQASENMANFMKQTGFESLTAAKKMEAVNSAIQVQTEYAKEQEQTLIDLKKQQDQAYVNNENKLFKKLGEKIKFQKQYIETNKIYISDLEKLKTTIKDIPATVPGLGEDPVKTLGLIEAAKKKVEELKTKIETAPSTTIAAAFSKDLIKAEEDLDRLQKKIRNKAFGAPVGEGLKPITPKPSGQVTGGTPTDYLEQKMLTLPVDTADAAAKASAYQESVNSFVSSNETLTMSFDGMVSDLAYGFGEAMAGTEDFGNVILMAIANFMGTLGQQMVQLGVAKIGLDKLLQVPGSGPALIAIGTALLALSGAAKATIASGINGKGGRGGGGSSSFSGTGQKDLTVQIEGITRGSDIYWSQKNYNKRLDSTTSRG
jgi:hypothetical protein